METVNYDSAIYFNNPITAREIYGIKEIDRMEVSGSYAEMEGYVVQFKNVQWNGILNQLTVVQDLRQEPMKLDDTDIHVVESQV